MDAPLELASISGQNDRGLPQAASQTSKSAELFAKEGLVPSRETAISRFFAAFFGRRGNPTEEARRPWG